MLTMDELSVAQTYHQAALLRDESKKKLFWEDLKKVKEKYDGIASLEQKKGL